MVRKEMITSSFKTIICTKYSLGTNYDAIDWNSRLLKTAMSARDSTKSNCKVRKFRMKLHVLGEPDNLSVS